VIAIDTNVLVRILADDPDQPGQVTAARALASDAGQLFVPTVVQVETVWVLETGYGLPKATIVAVLVHLETNLAFVQEETERSRRALALFRASNADYADCLILAGCQARDLELHTFDKRLGKLDGAVPIGANPLG
jgi:predicted nucleic-acid-binding protein